MTTLERAEVERLMPHGAGWVFIDKVLSCEPQRRIVTQRFIDPDDPILMSHFPNGPTILPGVILIEYAGQSAYLLGRLSGRADVVEPATHMLARCSASFLSPARAGDLLTAHVTLVDRVGETTVYDAVVTCDERIVCRVRVFGVPLGDSAIAAGGRSFPVHPEAVVT